MLQINFAFMEKLYAWCDIFVLRGLGFIKLLNA